MKKFEIYIHGVLNGWTTGNSCRSVEMRLRSLGYKTSVMDIVEVM